MIALAVAGFAVALAALGLAAYMVRRSGVERDQQRADVAAARADAVAERQRADEAVAAQRKAEVRAAQFEGVAKEQAAETIRAKYALKTAVTAARIHENAFHLAERQLADADVELHKLRARVPGAGRDQLLHARAVVKNISNLAGVLAATVADGDAGDRDLDDPEPLPDPPSAGRAGGGDVDPTLPGGR